MTRTMKAVLLSACVFPGSGHIYLKRFRSGAVLAGAALLSLYVLVSKTVERAVIISERIQHGEIPPDFAAISDYVSAQSTGGDSVSVNLATLVLIIVWLVGIVQSHRIGRRMGNPA